MDTFFLWKKLSISICSFTLFGSLFATGLTFAICRVSLRGTPTDTDARRLLPFLCKCNLTLVFIMKVIVFCLGILMSVSTDKYCNCVRRSQGFVSLDELRACPTYREWFVLVRIFLFLVACDIFLPSIIYLCMLRSRTRRLFRDRERVADDDYKWWRRCCRTCCEFSSLMTCYMFVIRKSNLMKN